LPDTTQVRAFFAHHLQSQALPYRDQASLRCPFHDDRTASLSINLQEGVWNCHAGCGSGGLVAFEMRMSNCDAETAKTNVTAIVGSDLFRSGDLPEAIYQYRDALRELVFEKLRYPGKQFRQRRPIGKGYAYDLHGIPKVLYNLPELVTANVVIVCEGEKDCDNVTRAIKTVGDDELKGARVVATTNFDGAGHWLEEYNPYFAGRKAIIIPDDDPIGAAHALRVARAVYPFAAGVKIVNLPGLGEKGDVTDFLQTHTVLELFAEMAKAPQWFPPKAAQSLFTTMPQFVATVPDDIDWLIEKVIQRSANGMIAAAPKAGKSWAASDMAIALALGEPWLGFNVPRPVKVALISREDSPQLTAWRLQNLWRGRSAKNPFLIETNLHINTRLHSPQLLLDNAEQLSEAIAAMKEFQPEFVILDVFNVLHSAEENDNSEMRMIMRQLSRIQSEVKCGIGVIHHYNKAVESNMMQRLRGASAIGGWCEWLIGISMQDEATKTRRMEFESKASESPEPVLFRIVTTGDSTTLMRSETATRMTNVLPPPLPPKPQAVEVQSVMKLEA
jgi:AAA domain/CHC2 zinc finger